MKYCKLTGFEKFVLITPGAIQFTRILLDANSVANILVSPNNAVLLTEYAPRS